MNTSDLYLRVVLTIIACCLVLLTARVMSLSLPTVHAAESLHCGGTVKVNAFGPTATSIGGYNVDFSCD